MQVPFEIAGQATVQMQVLDKQIPLAVSETHALAVADRQPAIFLSPAAWASPFPWYTECSGRMVLGKAAVALNADGTLNDCANPAIAGSVVTLFLDGLGQVAPALATGGIAQSPAVTLVPGVDALDGSLSPISATTSSVPGSISGLAQVQFQVPPVSGSVTPFLITPRVLGKNLRERLILIWARSN